MMESRRRMGLVIKIKKPSISMPPEEEEEPNVIPHIVPDHTDHCPKSKRMFQQTQSDADAEVEAMFDKVLKRRKKMDEGNPLEIGLLVEKVMALMEVAAEDDIQLNMESKPAIRKIQMLPLLTDFLYKKKLQQAFLDHGVLCLFKDWLEPLPDGSLPNATVRASVLNILTHVLPVDVSSEYRREQLKKSGLGKVIMFLSKSEEETTANRQLAKDLVESWSRTIFNTSERYSDLRNLEERALVPLKKATSVKKQSTTMELRVREADLDLELHPKKSDSTAATGSWQAVSVPKPTTFAYGVNPGSNCNSEIARNRLRYEKPRDCQSHKRIEKRLRILKKSKKKSLQATKLSANGRFPFAM